MTAASGIPDLILGILEAREESEAQEARVALASALDVAGVMLLMTDPQLGITLPAPGFPQRLYRAALWRREARLAAEQGGWLESSLPFPEDSTWIPAKIRSIADGTTVVLLGGNPSAEACGGIGALLPWISKLFGMKNALRIGQAEKVMALNAVATSNRMSATLEALRRSLETALRKTEVEQEKALREREERRKFVALVENSGEFISMADMEGRVIYLNPYGRSLIGLDESEALRGMTIEDFLDEDFRKSFADIVMPAILAGEPWEGEVRFRHGRTGAPLHVLQTLFVVRDPETHAPICIANVARDMTERRRSEEILKKTEAQLQQTQKMESVGNLAGGIAHDFNNLLTAINGYSELSLPMVAPDSQLYSNLQEIKKAGDRAAALTGQLLAYSRKQVLAPKLIDLNGLVSNMHNMLSRIIGEDIVLSLSLNEKLGRVKADPGQLEQVILNLVVNARDAAPSGGWIGIETDNVQLDGDAIANHPEVVPGEYVLLSVSDNGSGMESHVLAQIFEPFFTTKAFGKGSGMGLPMVQGIVNQTGGYIYAYSEPAKGSVFKIYLPLAESEVPQRMPSKAPSPEDLRGYETILLAEDEDSVRKLARGILERQGYTVLDAADGVEAQRQAAAYPGRIDLLLTDVIMPRKNGRELAQALTASRSGLKVIFMSGYTDDSVIRHGLIGVESSFIQKPLSPGGLVRVVREMLGDPPGDLKGTVQWHGSARSPQGKANRP